MRRRRHSPLGTNSQLFQRISIDHPIEFRRTFEPQMHLTRPACFACLRSRSTTVFTTAEEGMEASSAIGVRCFGQSLAAAYFLIPAKKGSLGFCLLAHFAKEGVPETVIPKINQETLAEMVGTTRSHQIFHE